MDELDPLLGVFAGDYPGLRVISAYALLDGVSHLCRVASPAMQAVFSVLSVVEGFDEHP